MSKYNLIIVGLGNPGEEYKYNRHNVGFRFVDQFANRLNVKFSSSKFNAQIAQLNLFNKNCLLVKPLTYMNASGISVKKILDYYKLSTENVLVIYDDIDFEVGEYRIKKSGTHGGHKGIKSILENLGTQDIKRIKIGVGKTGDMILRDWVTSDLSKNQIRTIDNLFLEINLVVNEIVEDSIDRAMNKYNKKKLKNDFVY